MPRSGLVDSVQPTSRALLAYNGISLFSFTLKKIKIKKIKKKNKNTDTNKTKKHNQLHSECFTFNFFFQAHLFLKTVTAGKLQLILFYKSV